MAENNKIINVLNVFPLTKLSEEWVKGVWDSDFTDVSGIDEDVILETEPATVLVYLVELTSCLNHWTKHEEGDGEGLWSVLVENDISLKTLQAYLAYLLIRGQKKHADVGAREVGIQAARAYVTLVQVPGSAAFKVFHPELFEKSIDLVKQLLILGSAGPAKRKRNSITPVKSSQSKRSKQRNNKRNSNASDVMEEGGDDVNDADDDEMAEDLAPQEMARLRKLTHCLLQDMVEFLEKFSIRQSASSGYHAVQVFAPLTRHEPELFDGNFGENIPVSRMSVPALAYKALLLLCTPLHGHVGPLTNATCKCLLPNLLMLLGDKAVQNISKQMISIRDIAINFVGHLLKQCGDRGQASVRTLLQHMCTKVTDRAEYRTKVAQAVVLVSQQLPAASYGAMVQWFHKLSRHSQINNRGFALEIVSTLLSSPERGASPDVPQELQTYITHKSLLGILLERCSDKAPTVRARAITCFGQCLSSADERVVRTVKDIMTPQFAPRHPNAPQRLIRTPGASIRVDSAAHDCTRGSEETIAQQTIEGASRLPEGSEVHEQEQITPMNRVHLTPGFDPNLSDSEGVFSMLRRRARDEKVNVRKAALQAIEAAIRFEMPNCNEQNLKVLRDHCRDPGLSARKQALQCLTDLLVEYPTHPVLQQTWLEGALPLVIDREQTLSDKCMETLEDLILNNVVLIIRSNSPCHQLAWDLLGVIARPHSVDQRRYLQKACAHWSRQGKIKPALISALESHIGSENNAGAWMLLAEIAPAAPKINPSFLLKYWTCHGHDENSSDILERVLTVMKYVAKHLQSSDRENLSSDLKSRLLKFDSPPELISVTVATLSKLCSVQSSESGNVALATEWAKELLTACDSYLSKVILQNDGINSSEDMVVCYLFTLGEVVQLCPGQVPKRVFLLVQSMIAAPCLPLHPPPSEAHTSAHTSAGSDGLSNSQGSTDSHGTQASQGTQFTQGTQLTQFRGSQMSSRIRAFAFITLGKLCLQHEQLAKKVIAALARELEVSTETAIRNNVMMVMCDLCVRYTTTANHYITNISSCLKDRSPLVRKQTLTLITRLLQEDFLKWKGALFYRFISTLLDECEEIAKFGEFCLLHMLIQRHPTMFFQHFMECVFHFNDYRDHAVYNKFSQTEKDRHIFSLKGEQNARFRDKLYKFLLEHMSDDHRFQIQSKLVQEVLGGIVDNILPINADTSELLKDVLAILSCKEIKLSSLKVKPTEEVATDEQEMAAVVIATAKKTIITQVVKKNVMENVVPIVVSLKHLMERQKSPLIKQVLTYLRELVKDYKTEVKEILSADRQLATEIEFDLRKFEEEQEALVRKLAPNVAPSVQGTPRSGGARSPQIHANSPGPNHATQSPLARSPMGTASPSRSPALKATPAPGARKVGSPVLRIAPLRATPMKDAPLSTLALLNSARRAMQAPQTPVVLNQNVEGDSRSAVRPARSQGSTPQMSGKAAASRAISTPSVAMGNITFHGDANMTFMPPSPIVENVDVQHLYDESSAICDKENDSHEENVLLLKSPMAANPRPRVWNVLSPAPQKSGKRVSKEGESVQPTSVLSSQPEENEESDSVVEEEQLQPKAKPLSKIRNKSPAKPSSRPTRKKAPKK
ncbi:condensin-2 complex subunit D3-like isoform X2 [Dreissena polymorpha]|uniref:condensin-2 complex subunit D3-like isoform X2 n=1 Tax=Dreissena polymorpha TaxID=45954 RepID=UPI002265475B|nr:condensin-2 complex subunit D3-like isoform X2 [Dreissena polymorpha]